MTEAEWLACVVPERMMKRFYPRPSSRKYRLFACACCRHSWKVSPTAPSPLAVRAVELAELFADSLAVEAELMDCLTRLKDGRRTDLLKGIWIWDPRKEDLDRLALRVTGVETVSDAKGASSFCRHVVPSPDQALTQVGFNRDIFGNPFRPVTFSPSWRTDTVLTLARQMYDSRDFSATPILADALQDAGCDNEDILNHCRDANATHVRGCWVVDLVLGKE
jgi:hypothetical protein